MTSIQQTHPNLQSLTELSEEQLATYRDDEAFAASVDALIRQNAAQAAANDATMRNTASGGARGSTPKGLLEQKNNNTAGGNQRPYKMMALRCSRYPGADPAKLRTAASSAFAQKVREMSGTERDSAFDALCKELAVPEAREDRLEFFYAVIAWITLNTASTENGIDSVIGGKYSSTQMLEFFNHDLRPFARALANDAKDFISFVTSERSHELYEPFNNLARKYEVPKTPWLIYDGIDAAKITGGEAKIADLIKQSRLNNNVDYNASAAINRQVLKGNNYSGRPNN